MSRAWGDAGIGERENHDDGIDASRRAYIVDNELHLSVEAAGRVRHCGVGAQGRRRAG